MFVKKSWDTTAKNPKISHSIVKSYRDPETNTPRHRTILNISCLPQETIEAIDLSLKDDKRLVDSEDISFSTGDALRGAGSLAIYRLWQKENMEKVLKGLTPAQRESVMVMVMQRILKPGSKNAIKEDFADSIFKRCFSKKRFDENELYKIMDLLFHNYYDIQKRLRESNDSSNTLLLYDITSTYFEGQKAEGGEYGYSRDHRQDRCQIIIGLVCNEKGLPLSIEVWPGNTADKTTVKEQVKKLKETFGIEEAIIVGDKGMYSKANINKILDEGLDYILSTDWRLQKDQLLSRTPKQLSLLDDVGILEWEDDGTRFIGCSSKWRKKREMKRRIQGIKTVKSELKLLKKTAAKGSYYSWNSLYKKIEDLLESAGVKDLWNITIKPLDPDKNPDEKGKFDLEFSLDKKALKERKKREGKFVLETSIDKADKDAEEIKEAFMKQPQIERAFRNIKSFLKIRPVFHWKERRIKAHVLICFLAFYLAKKAEIKLRENDITREAVEVIRNWEKLRLTEITLDTGKDKLNEWQWQMGRTGTRVKDEISDVGWWRSIQGYKRSILSDLDK